MSRSADRIYAHLDRWLTAGAATAYADRLETLRRLWFRATGDRHILSATAGNHQKRGNIAVIRITCSTSANSTNPGAHLKTP